MKINKKILLTTLSFSAITSCIAIPIIVDKTIEKQETTLVLNTNNSSEKKENKNPSNIWIIYVVFGAIIFAIISFIVIFEIVTYFKKKKHHIDSTRDFDIGN